MGPKIYILKEALALSITKLKADSDSDTPIESYATLKTVRLWNRLAPRKNAFLSYQGYICSD